MSVRSTALDALARLFVRVLELLGDKHPNTSLDPALGPVYLKRIARGAPMLNQILTNEQKFHVTLNPTTAAGNPATIDGTPSWVSADPTVATVEPSEDGKSAFIVSGDAPGQTVITVTADADLDEGEIREVSDVINVVVVQAEADNLGFAAGEPELK